METNTSTTRDPLGKESSCLMHAFYEHFHWQRRSGRWAVVNDRVSKGVFLLPEIGLESGQEGCGVDNVLISKMFMCNT